MKIETKRLIITEFTIDMAQAVIAFLPVITGKIGIDEIYGICLKENAASHKVMEKCGFENVFDGVGKYQGVDREIVKNVWKV